LPQNEHLPAACSAIFGFGGGWLNPFLSISTPAPATPQIHKNPRRVIIAKV
jgi:hypothetical protein